MKSITILERENPKNTKSKIKNRGNTEGKKEKRPGKLKGNLETIRKTYKSIIENGQETKET